MREFLPNIRNLRDTNGEDLANFKIRNFLDDVLQEITAWLAALDDVDIIGDPKRREKTFFRLHDYLIQVNRDAYKLESFPDTPTGDIQEIYWYIQNFNQWINVTCAAHL